ncbi:MAG: dihydroorotase [Phycisphaerales bacterium]
MTTDTLITGARILDPAHGRDETADLLITDGVIAQIGAGITPPDGARTIDASGLSIAPAFVEIHAHLREPGGEASETIATAARAAAKGGYAHVFGMPNTSPVCDSVMGVRYVLDRAREAGSVHVHPVGSVTTGMKGETLTDFHALLEAGAGALSDDGLPVADAGMMRLALQCAADLGCVILDHCEDMSLTGDGVMHDGPHARALGLPGIPRSSEATIALRDGLLALETGGRLHVCHVSTVDTVEAVRWLKSRGAPVTAEVSPHHLTLTDERVGDFDTHAKMKPPLCEEHDRLALIEALEDGTIDCIATDHAPHAPGLKARMFDAAPFGIIGMETAFAVCHTAFVETGRWSLSFLLEKLTVAPARIVGRPWGTLAEGGPADLVVLDTAERFTMTESHLGSASVNCPWLGERLVGRPVATVIEGVVAHDEGVFAN